LRLANLALGLWVLVSIAIWHPGKAATMWVIGLALSVSGLAQRGAVARLAGAALGVWLAAWTITRDRATESMPLVASNLIVAMLIVATAVLADDSA
jgi:hypothetical protein